MYEEKFIDNILMYRTSPNGDWEIKLGLYASIANCANHLSEFPDKNGGDDLAYSKSTEQAWMFYYIRADGSISSDDYITNVNHWMPLPEPPNPDPQ